MSIFTRTRPSVKPHRKTTRKPGPFAAGLFRPEPVAMPRRVRWHALELSTAEDRHYDEMAMESAAYDAMEAGLIPPDVAEELSRTSLVGHPA